MENINWSFSRTALKRRLGLKQLCWLNDFEANAYALPHLGPQELQTINPGQTGGKRLAVAGPGTGFGGATLDLDTGRATASEPGFAGLSPATIEELEIFRRLLPRHGAIHAELLVSGPGLLRLYQTLAEVRGQPALLNSPEAVTSDALDNADPLARDTLHCFVGLFGSCCGDFVVSSGSLGGLYLAGGIVPNIVNALASGQFMARFTAKAGMQRYLSQVPVNAITAPFPGLLGAANAPTQTA